MLGPALTQVSIQFDIASHVSWDDFGSNGAIRDLICARFGYRWADSIHIGVKTEGANGQCLRLIVVVTIEGKQGAGCHYRRLPGIVGIIAEGAAASEGSMT